MIRVMAIRQRLIPFDDKEWPQGWRYVLASFRAADMWTVFIDVFSTVWNLASAMVDAAVLRLPDTSVPLRGGDRVVFMYHSPNTYHLFTPFPVLRYLPEPWVLWLMTLMSPCRLGKIDGRRPDGSVIRGTQYVCLVTPEQIFNPPAEYCRVSPTEAVALVERATELARRWGAHTVGLGAYLPTLTWQGKTLADNPKFEGVGITTGHSCTVAIIRQYLYELAEMFRDNLKHEVVAIVGAAGATGRAVAKTLARDQRLEHLLLLDLPGKEDKLASVAEACRRLSPSMKVVTTTVPPESGVLKPASFVIMLTTATGSILKPEDLGESTIVIDDTMPRNTRPDTLAEPITEGRVLVLDVLAQVPGLSIGFDYDVILAKPEFTYTCAAELKCLQSVGHRGNYSVGEVSADQVLTMVEYMKVAGVTAAPLTSFRKVVGKEDLARFLDRRTQARRTRRHLHAVA